MKRDDLINAAKDLEQLLYEGNATPVIDLSMEDDALKSKIKEVALWLLESDELLPVTIDVLKSLNWTEDDFKELEDPEEQDPIPAFARYGITIASAAKPTRRKPAKKETPVPEEPELGETVASDAPEEPEPEADEPEGPREVPEEYLDRAPDKKPKPKGPSAYGTALALMGPEPTITLPDLMDKMRDEGFDIQEKHGTIKTAHSIFRKVYRYLKENGHIKKS